MPKKTSSLTRGDFWHLCEAVKEHASFFNEKKFTYTQAADFLSGHLSLAITPDQIREACSLTKVTWENPRAGVGKNFHKNGDLAERVAKIEDRLEKFLSTYEEARKRQNAQLAQAWMLLRDLYSRSGIKFPAISGPDETTTVTGG